MIKIFEQFGRVLEKRFRRKVFTTEDSIRYTFFASLLKSGVTPDQVVLEYPHRVIDRAEIDTWLPSYNGGSIAVEFKYDRDPPGGKNQPKTQKAGAVFEDLRRQVLLAEKKEVRSYFVYVTSEEMAVYFRNPKNGHSKWWGLGSGSEVLVDDEYLSKKPQAFLGTLGSSFVAKVVGVFHSNLPGGNYVRVYEVLPHVR